ncbi:MAG: glycerophosphodiester phosphodiesterase [Candidatus Thorarchaeota archaeon]
MKPFVFAHRGASGYEIENTIPSFKKAVRMEAGIETDVQETKDKKLICFHDYFIEANSEKYDLKRITLKKLRSLKFIDNRKIPSVQEVFELFHKNHSLRYSFDIRDKFAGFKLIDIAKRFNILDRIEITERRLKCISSLRSYNKKVKIVHTLPEIIKQVNKNTVNFDMLKNLEVYAINLIFLRSSFDNFKEIIDNGFKCYIWSVNAKSRMKKVLKLKFKNEGVDAIYTDYPDIFINLRDQIKG